MRTIYVDKNIPRALLTKAIAPLWPGFVWTRLSAARYADLPEPPLPGPRWIRLRNQQCGICASDMSLLFVQADPSVAPAALPGLSRFWLGHETVSVVTEIGEAVSRFKVGDIVVMDTHFAGANCKTLEIQPKCRYCAGGDFHFCINKSEPGPRGIGGGFGDSYVTHESAVYPAAGGLSRDELMFTEPFSIPMHAVMRYPPKAGEKVLVYGAGIMGLLTTMVVRALVPEAEIAVLARYPHQREMALMLGARHVLSERDNYQEVARLTAGKFYSGPLNRGVVINGFDIIYDCVANARTTNDSLRWVRAGGTVMMVGAHMAPMPKVDLTPVWYHQVSLVGTYGHGMNTWDGISKHTFEWVYAHFKAGRFDIDGLITHRFPMKDYRQAIRVATSKGREKAIKVVLEQEA